MCGISGFIDFNKKTGIEVLEKMNRIMAHRGPDGEGYGMYETAHATIGLGHRRLSIIDLTAGGHQPKTFDSLHLTFNGEIYNYAEIKKELEAKGTSLTARAILKLFYTLITNGEQQLCKSSSVCLRLLFTMKLNKKYLPAGTGPG